jgi:hypothetical protein
MKLINVPARPCPCCSLDLQRLYTATDGFRVICDPEEGGCGTESDHGDSESEAVTQWNGGEVGRHRARRVIETFGRSAL